ncbi:MAG TPA: class I SAM-dependent methyltransferase [Thermoanaerobaculia bacterium]
MRAFPRVAGLRLLLGSVLLEGGRKVEGLRELELAFDLGRAETASVLGVALRRLGRPAAAARAFERALALDPTHPTAAGERDACLAAAGASLDPGGDELADLLARLAPGRPPVFMEPGWRPWALSLAFDGPMLVVEGVKGFLIPGDVEMLRRLAAWLPPGGTYVEIGSFMGLSSALVASTLVAVGNHEARFYCVDTWEGSVEHQDLEVIQRKQLYHIFCDNIQSAGVAPMVRPVRMPSVEAVRFFPPASVDLVFVDGDHTYEGCLADLEAWWPTIKPGGRVLGHDCVPGECVDRAVRAFAARRGLELEIHPPPASHYIFELHARGVTPGPVAAQCVAAPQ